MSNEDRYESESDYSSDGSATLHDRPPAQRSGYRQRKPDRIYESTSSEVSESDESDTLSRAILDVTDYVTDAVDRVAHSLSGSERSVASDDNTEDDHRRLRNEMGDSESESEESDEQSESDSDSESEDGSPLKFVYHEEFATAPSIAASAATSMSEYVDSTATERNDSLSHVSGSTLSNYSLPPPPPRPNQEANDDASVCTDNSSLPSELQPITPPMLTSTTSLDTERSAESLENPDEHQSRKKQPFFARFSKKNKKKQSALPEVSEVSEEEGSDDTEKNLDIEAGRDVTESRGNVSSNDGHAGEISPDKPVPTATDSQKVGDTAVLLAPVPLEDRNPSVPVESVENVECVMTPTTETSEEAESAKKPKRSLPGSKTAGLMMGSLFSRKKKNTSETTGQSDSVDLVGIATAPAPNLNDIEMSMQALDQPASDPGQEVSRGAIAAEGITAVTANATKNNPGSSSNRLSPERIDQMPNEEVPSEEVKDGTLLVIRSKILGRLSKTKQAEGESRESADPSTDVKERGVDVGSAGEKVGGLDQRESSFTTADSADSPSQYPPTPERVVPKNGVFLSRDVSVSDASTDSPSQDYSDSEKRAKRAALLGFDGSEPPEESRRFIIVLVLVCIAAFIATFFGVWLGLGKEKNEVSKSISDGTGVANTSPSAAPTTAPWMTIDPASPTSSNNSQTDPTSPSTTAPSLSNLGSAPVAEPTSTKSPTRLPTTSPTRSPTSSPTLSPTVDVTASPSATPSKAPTSSPTSSPTQGPTASPTASPTANPTQSPTANPTERPVSFHPGKLEVLENGLLLSEGLSATVIARTDQSVAGSSDVFHSFPDAAACFAHPDGIENGWAYVSNSDDADEQGGVGAIYFDGEGQVTGYQRLLEGTTYNSGGGVSPWGTWISAEESLIGEGFWDVDPYNSREPALTALGNNVALYYDSFTFDARNENDPKFFFSEDSRSGPVRRFTPNPDLVVPLTDPNAYMMIQEGYDHEYLVLEPNEGADSRSGNFRWSQERDEGEASALNYLQNVEGVYCVDGTLILATKRSRQLVFLNLDTMTYFLNNPVQGLFEGEPDSVTSLYKTGESAGNNVLFITEEADAADGFFSGVHGLEEATGNYFPLLKATGYSERDEVSGVALSPDRVHMYVAIQDEGVILDVFRTDGLPFGGPVAGVQYTDR